MKEKQDYQELKKEYKDLKQDYEVITLNSSEVLRIGGYYKKKYYEYRETVRKIAELFEISEVISKKDVTNAGITLDANDKPVLPLYDKHAEVKNEH